MPDHDDHPPPQEADDPAACWDGLFSEDIVHDAADADESAADLFGERAPVAPAFDAVDRVGWAAIGQDERDPATLAHAELNAVGCTEADRRRIGRTLLTVYGRRFWALAQRRHRCLNYHDTEELVSGTICAFMMHCRADCAEPEAWLYAVFRNLAHSRRLYMNAACRNPGSVIVSIDALDAHGQALHETLPDAGLGDPVRALCEQQFAALVGDALVQIATTSSAERATVLLLTMKGYSRGEVAATLGKSPAAVRDQLYQARALLEAILKERQV